MMKHSKTILLIGVVVLLTLASGGVVAQHTAEPGALALQAPIVAPAISYQGRLVDPGNGDPLTGTFDFQFSFWDDPSAGNLMGGQVYRPNQEVLDGYYRTIVDVDPGVVDGTGMWMRIQVRESGTIPWDTLSPRIEVLPVMYAMTVRPGARIVGPVGRPNAVLNATSTSHGFGLRGESLHEEGYGVVGYNGSGSNSTFGAGVKGGTITTGYGVLGTSDSGHGVGVLGYTEDGYGVQGIDAGSEEARGYGGYFTSSNGVGAYGWSKAYNTGDNLYAPGLYGGSLNGVGVYGRSWGGGGWRTAGVMGWGIGGPGGEFYTYNGNIIEGYEDYYLENDVDLRLKFKVTLGGDVYADGGYWSPAADFAELMPAREGLEPGDVLVVGPDGQLARSTQAYQSTVVGVHSTKPGFLGGVPEDAGGNEVQVRQGAEPVAREKDEATMGLAADGKVPLAIAGIVPVKASAENGAITPGALLVAADTPGHCMLAGENPPVGTVLGKALEGLERGTGIILMLVMLQ
jgi:hypothetical protein